ncbi:MAG: hypothetical protein SH868_01580 [Bythopirellula sp.]|nr:hypothetical protein [Bythopirellula sp.]
MASRLPPDRLPAEQKPRAGLLGVAFDAEDGHKRITRGPNFLLAGGSHETHGQMQETAIKVNEQLARKGKDLAEVSVQELRDIVADVVK